jgi:hypothetical protein
MSKHIPVKDCTKCPYLLYNDSDGAAFCDNINKILPKFIIKIPDHVLSPQFISTPPWCQLDDWKSEGEE